MDTEPIVVHLIALGCAKNLVDSEVMCGVLAANGMLLATDPEEADVILVNTCGFIRDARTEAEQEIVKALRWKKRGLRAGVWRAVVVGGCMPQKNPRECAEKYPEVDLFLGLNDVPRVYDLIRSLAEGKLEDRNVPPTCLPEYLYDENTPRITVTPANYAYVKIAEGCDHRCAFCAIPGIRGHLRSRTQDSVLAECRNLLAQGAREINLIAQDTTSYGRDLKDGTSLASLLRALDALDGEFWIRILYTHPYYMTDEVLELMAHSRHVVPYLDMPLQHISNHVLIDMQRRMDGPQTRALMEKIKKDYPELTVRTTLLVGFPGETDEDFQELLAFVKEYEFDRMGVFVYSPEEGTPGARMTEGKVPQAVANRRKKALLKAQQAISQKKNQALIGQEVTVLLEEQEDRRIWSARMVSDAAEVDNLVHVRVRGGVDGVTQPFCRVKITAAGEYDYEARQI